MKKSIRTTSLLAALVLTSTACRPMAEQVQSDFAGLNGGFEHVEDDLPVNWLVYTEETVPSGRFDVLLDTTDYKEGEQSLLFRIEECAATGGWYSPGISNQLPATPDTTYRLRCWIKSEGCDWTLSVGGVAAKTGEYDRIPSSRFEEGDWQEVRHEYTLPPEYEELRIELSITSPGRLWIDGLVLEPALSGG